MTYGIDDLRARYPDWQIDSVWITQASASGARLIYAKRDGVELRAWSVEALARALRDAA